jgi:hypothetical protein
MGTPTISQISESNSPVAELSSIRKSHFADSYCRMLLQEFGSVDEHRLEVAATELLSTSKSETSIQILCHFARGQLRLWSSAYHHMHGLLKSSSEVVAAITMLEFSQGKVPVNNWLEVRCRGGFLCGCLEGSDSGETLRAAGNVTNIYEAEIEFDGNHICGNAFRGEYFEKEAQAFANELSSRGIRVR